MSGKLDQSLDEILSSTKRSHTRSKRGRPSIGRNGKGTVATAAPVGGVTKNTRNAKVGTKNVPTGPAAGRRSIGGSLGSKAIISNLPKDVSEAQIKDFFAAKKNMPVKRVELAYGPNSMSKGTATIHFVQSDGANLAMKEMNGILIDNRPIKVEIIIDATVAAALPGPKGLSERVTQPKPQPKSAAASKATTNGATRGNGRGRRGRGGRNSRPAKKTAEELDSEMADYFGGGGSNAGNENEAAATNGAAAPDAMEEEVL